MADWTPIGLLCGLLLAALVPSNAWAETGCERELEVRSARVVFSSPTFQGKPTRRDARVDVELRSTSTSALSQIELAIFLGASLEKIESTRLGALPTRRPREMEGGGLAFRGSSTLIIPPGASRTVQLEKEELPIEADLGSVRARIVSCRHLVAVGEATVALPAEADPPLTLYVVVGTLLAAGAAAVLYRRLR